MENAKKLDIDEKRYEKLRDELRRSQSGSGGMNEDQINKLLDREIPIQRLLLEEEQDKIKKAINLKVDFDPLFKLQNIKNPEDINKWLDTQITIKTKEKEAKELGIFFPWNYDKSNDDEKIQWLDNEIAKKKEEIKEKSK